MRTLLLIFACKDQNKADTGGVEKRSTFADVLYGWPLILALITEIIEAKRPKITKPKERDELIILMRSKVKIG